MITLAIQEYQRSMKMAKKSKNKGRKSYKKRRSVAIIRKEQEKYTTQNQINRKTKVKKKVKKVGINEQNKKQISNTG